MATLRCAQSEGSGPAAAEKPRSTPRAGGRGAARAAWWPGAPREARGAVVCPPRPAGALAPPSRRSDAHWSILVRPARPLRPVRSMASLFGCCFGSGALPGEPTREEVRGEAAGTGGPRLGRQAGHARGRRRRAAPRAAPAALAPPLPPTTRALCPAADPAAVRSLPGGQRRPPHRPRCVVGHAGGSAPPSGTACGGAAALRCARRGSLRSGAAATPPAPRRPHRHVCARGRGQHQPPELPQGEGWGPTAGIGALAGDLAAARHRAGHPPPARAPCAPPAPTPPTPPARPLPPSACWRASWGTTCATTSRRARRWASWSTPATRRSFSAP
jgi:hypothetical protein